MNEAEEAVLSTADALGAAWDAAEDDNEPDITDDSGALSESIQEESEDAAGSGSEHDAEVQPEGEPAGVQRESESESATSAPDQPSLDTPPKGLSPEAREAWKDTPEAVRKEIAKREADFERGIVKYAQNAQRAEQMDKVLGPYQQLFAMNGGPSNTLPGLLQTAAMLQMGSPMQRASTVANLIKQFGVDVRALDGLLTGKGAPPEVQQQSEVERLLEQRLQPIQQQLTQYQQREQMQVRAEQEQIHSEIADFASQHEFYSDVSEEMADLLDMAANRGRNMTMEEAYNIACSTHPQISKIMQARTSAESAQRRQAAASSVRGTPGSDNRGGAPSSRLAAIQDAWDNAGRM